MKKNHKLPNQTKKVIPLCKIFTTQYSKNFYQEKYD